MPVTNMAETKKEHIQGNEKALKKTLARWGLVNDNLNALKVFR